MQKENGRNNPEAENIDPVCGMPVKPEEAACSYEYKGKKYYFCAESCRDTFMQDPTAYLRPN